MIVRGELVLADLAAQRVAVNTEDLCGTGLVAVCAVQNPLDEAFFKFFDSLIEQNPSFHHLCDKPLELIFHGRTLRGICSCCYGPV